MISQSTMDDPLTDRDYLFIQQYGLHCWKDAIKLPDPNYGVNGDRDSQGKYESPTKKRPGWNPTLILSQFAEKGHLSNFGKDFKPLLYNIWNTQESIAGILGVDRKYVERTVNGHIGQMSDLTKDFKPLLYNIWNTQESIAGILGVDQKTVTNIIEDRKKSTRGNFPKDFKPLLYNICIGW